MKKPVKKNRHPPAYLWNEITKWIMHKTGKDLRDWAGRLNKCDETIPYQDFWHWLLDRYDIHNGCYIDIELHDPPADAPWVKEVMDLLKEELGEEEIYCWVVW